MRFDLWIQRHHLDPEYTRPVTQYSRMVGKPLAASEHDSDKCVIMNYSNRFSLLERLLTNAWQLNSLSGCGEFQSVKKKIIIYRTSCQIVELCWRKLLFFFSLSQSSNSIFWGVYTNKTLLVWQVLFLLFLLVFVLYRSLAVSYFKYFMCLCLWP